MYVQQSLLSNEKIIHFARPHWIIFTMPFSMLVLGVLFLIFGPSFFATQLTIFSHSIHELLAEACFIVAIVTGLAAYVRYVTSEYAITNKRILLKTGWIRRSTLELFLQKVEALHINQTIMGRILDYGALVVIGTGGTQDLFPLVPSPLKFRHIAQQQVDSILEDNTRKESVNN